uniref:Phosphatase and actin regulator n=1 Tax=Athene cunicularia TaxID=194338 RepID=A0A663M9A0_ATHCN
MDNAVDGLDKASIANSDGPAPGSQTPPFKRKGKLSTIGKIFKPWKWRKKKTSDKFRETSAVLERKISTRQSREELIRRGVLKEMPEQDGDVTVNFETSNGHTIAIGEETIQEENVVKTSGDNGSLSEKASALEGKKEDQKESTTDHCPEIPASHAPPLPKPKPKPKKAPLPPKNAIAASTTSHNSNEAPHAKKKGKAPAKQPPLPPPKPTSHSANREAGEYCTGSASYSGCMCMGVLGSLASKIRRRDTLAIKLGNRPSKKELEDKNILQRTSEEERQEIRHQIGTKLVRRLSQRPTTEELEQRNILKQKNEEEEQEAKREIKRRLSRKLSLRPTVAELQARRILRFNEYVEVTDSPDYDRRADKPWARLTPADKAAIRKELNEFKSTEMEVHEESRQFTRWVNPSS